MLRIDLNADLGEGFGRYAIPGDEAVLDLVTSANVACGFHAGDPVVMTHTVARAAARGVSIGAHPGYPDLLGFGRRELMASAQEIGTYVTYQIGALQAICRVAGTRVRYVKPHGALFMRAVKDPSAADAIAEATRKAGEGLILLGLPGTQLSAAAERAGIGFAAEAFIDRGYFADGTLVPRSEPGAMVHDPTICADRAARMVLDGIVEAVDGSMVELQPDSLCAHGDGPTACEVLEAVRARLESSGVTIAPFAA
jgi:UPF0271 protein